MCIEAVSLHVLKPSRFNLYLIIPRSFGRKSQVEKNQGINVPEFKDFEVHNQQTYCESDFFINLLFISLSPGIIISSYLGYL